MLLHNLCAQLLPVAMRPPWACVKRTFLSMGLPWTFPVVIVVRPQPFLVRSSQRKAMITALWHALMVHGVQLRMPPVFGDQMHALDATFLRQSAVSLVPARLRWAHAFAHSALGSCFQKMSHLFQRFSTQMCAFLDNLCYPAQKLLGYARGAPPRVQIR